MVLVLQETYLEVKCDCDYNMKCKITVMFNRHDNKGSNTINIIFSVNLHDLVL